MPADVIPIYYFKHSELVLFMIPLNEEDNSIPLVAKETLLSAHLHAHCLRMAELKFRIEQVKIR